MELREAIEKLTMWHQANPRTGPLGVVLNAVADGTLIPADAMFQVKEGYEVGAAKVDADGNLQRIAEFSEALEIRSADSVRREALEEAVKAYDHIAQVYHGRTVRDMQGHFHKAISALIDTPQPKYDLKCPDCNGTGLRDTGGVHPWGEGIFVGCDCDTQPKGGDDA